MLSMKFDPKIHHRRSIRLKGYDYRQAGGYFVTLVTQGREALFGEMVNGETSCEGKIVLNDAGEMIVRWWLELPNKFPNVNVDIFVVMPNHFHGIIFIQDSTVGADLPVGADLRVGLTSPAKPIPSDGIFPRNGGGYVDPPQPTDPSVRADLRVAPDLPQQRFNAPLSQMIQWFKTMTTNEYIRGIKQLGWKPFDRRLWQRDYYEHIIRSDNELDRIARYIESNPARWSEDNENPDKS
jgi:REP element-mobilizing transposase RayT